MFSRLPKELKELQKSNVSINEVLRYYDESRNIKHKKMAKKIWINKRKKIREKLHLDKENKEEEEAAFNRNLKRLEQKKEQLKKEEEFNKKKRQITKQYEQKQRDDLKPGKGIIYRESKSWKNRNNKTRKSPLSKQYYPSNDSITLENKNVENEDLVFVEVPKTGAGKKTRRRRRKTNKRKRKKRMKGGIRPRTQSEEDHMVNNFEFEIPQMRTYHEWLEEEHGSLQDFLNRPHIEMGDIIFYSSGNQYSDAEWIVVPDSNGNKTLRNYATYQTSDEEGEEKEEERPRTPETNKQGNKKGGKKTRKRRRSRKRKQTRKKNKRRRKRKTRRKRAGKPTFIKQSKIDKGIQGCNTLHTISEVHKCRNMGGLEKYNKKKMIGKIHLPHFNRPHLPHFKTQTEKNNEKLANMEWGDMGFGKQ